MPGSGNAGRKQSAVHESKTQILIDSKGFTLVEIMIAMVLFSVALMGIASLATVVIRGNFLSKQITTTSVLAQQKLEDNLGKGYSALTPGTNIENYGNISTAKGNAALYSGYKRVSVIRDGPIANTLMLKVTVHRRFDNVSSSFSTIIAK